MHFGYCTLRLSYATLLVHTSSSSSQNFNILVCLCASVSCSAAAVAAAAANVNKLGMCRDPVYVSCLQSKKKPHTEPMYILHDACSRAWRRWQNKIAKDGMNNRISRWLMCVSDTTIKTTDTIDVCVFKWLSLPFAVFASHRPLHSRVYAVYVCVCVWLHSFATS